MPGDIAVTNGETGTNLNDHFNSQVLAKQFSLMPADKWEKIEAARLQGSSVQRKRMEAEAVHKTWSEEEEDMVISWIT